MTIKVLGAITALFALLSTILGFLWLSTSHSLESLQKDHKQLTIDYSECVEGKQKLYSSYESTLKVVLDQRQALSKLKDKEQIDIGNLATYTPKCVVNLSGVPNEVDIDAPLDPEFIRVSEGNN